MWTGLRKSLVLCALLGSNALAVLYSPPVNKPSWWVAPPGSATRLQYHSFTGDPNQTQPSDYTLDGFDPGYLPSPPYPLSTKDWWTTTGVSSYNSVTSAGPEYGDNAAAMVAAGSTLVKAMGNEPQFPEKTYFYEVVWTTQLFYGGGAQPLNFPQLSVAGFGPSATYAVTGDGGGLFGSNRIDSTPWYVTYWTGTITPQPDYETFSILFPEASMVDSVWVGTICPEPLCLGGLGILGFVGFRRIRK